MIDLFATLDAPTAAVEGGYSNNPSDSGGETNHGITIGTARANGYMGPMIAMSSEQAASIRKTVFYMRTGVYLIAPVNAPIASEVYDSAVNLGGGTAVMWLQRALNALSRNGSDYAKVNVDGVIGAQTTFALVQYLRRRGPEGQVVMLRALNALQGATYIQLEEQHENDAAFLYGWLANRVAIA